MINSTIKQYSSGTINQLCEKHWWAVFGLVYLLSWLSVYQNLTLAPRLIILCLLIVIQLISYRFATLSIILISIILFYQGFFREVGLPGITPLRLLFFPYLYLSLSKPKLRDFPVNWMLVSIVLISILSLKISANVRLLIQDIPPQFQFHFIEPSLINTLSSYFDMAAKLSVFYFAFTRLSIKDLNWLFDGVLLIIFFETLCISYLVYENPEAVLSFRESLDDNRILWNNPYFGHKNDWGMLFALVVGVIVIKLLIEPHKKFIYVLFLLGVITSLAFSLSRQAYLNVFLILTIILFSVRNYKLFLVSSVLVIIVLTVQPKFIQDRVESIFQTETIEDFKSLNQKFSNVAIAQIKNNMRFTPQMFLTDTWEYNWSEGFWNGMLHQQGIPGLIFHVLLYGFLVIRYLHLSFTPNHKLKYYSLMGIIFTLIMFISHFNRQTFHFAHYNGDLTPENFVLIFVFVYIELVNYCYRLRLKQFNIV